MKKFKKLMSALLACAMLLAIAIPVASVAADGEIAITVETVKAEAGAQNVEVKLLIPTGWSGIGLTFSFNPEQLTYKSFVTNKAIQDQSAAGEPNVYALNKNDAASGTVIVSFASAVVVDGVEGYSNVDEDGESYDYFGTFKFNVAEGLADGLYEITATVDKLVGPDGDLQYTFTAGGIQIGEGEEPPVDPCDHEWGEWEVTTPATCVAKGEKTRTCSKCQETETEEIDIDPDAHDWGEWEDCADKEGYEQRVCKNDPSHVEERKKEGGEEPPVPYDGIEFVIETVEAAAGDKGVEVKLYAPTGWSGIGLTFSFNPEQLTYKSFVTNKAIQDQAANGEPNVYALNKNDAANGTVIVSFASAVVVDGVEGYSNVDEDGTAYDYFGTFKFDVAEGLEDGLYEITATLDKLVGPDGDLEGKVTAGGIKIGADECEHEWNDGEVTKPATCTEAGTIVYTCTKCQETREETIDALGHDWGEWEVTKPATCTEKGEKTRTCQREGCGETETEEIDIDENAHDWVEIGKTPATCAAKGSIQYACSINPDHTKEEEIDIDPDAHDWGEWEVVKEATETEDGLKQRVCKNDPSHIETEVIKATGGGTTPEEPTAPSVTGIEEGQEFDLGKGEKPAPTWEPADAPATLDDGTGAKPYTAGTPIEEAGEYTLVVTGADGTTTTIHFTVKDTSESEEPVNPDQPNTSDLPVAGIAIIALIASAAVVVIARKKRLA